MTPSKQELADITEQFPKLYFICVSSLLLINVELIWCLSKAFDSSCFQT